MMTGDTPDIMEFLGFAPYDWVWFKHNARVGPPELARWLGVSYQIGKLMSYWLLPKLAIPVLATTVQRVTPLEMQTAEWEQVKKSFEEAVQTKLESNAAIIPAILTLHNKESVLNLGLEGEDPKFIEEFN